MSTTIRVSEKTRNTLHQLARDVGAPMADVVERAIEQYRRQHIQFRSVCRSIPQRAA